MKNPVHRTVHALDVISSFSRSSKCTKIVGCWAFGLDPTGEADSIPSGPIAGFKGAYFKAPTSKRIGRGKGDRAPK